MGILVLSSTLLRPGNMYSRLVQYLRSLFTMFDGPYRIHALSINWMCHNTNWRNFELLLNAEYSSSRYQLLTFRKSRKKKSLSCHLFKAKFISSQNRWLSFPVLFLSHIGYLIFVFLKNFSASNMDLCCIIYRNQIVASNVCERWIFRAQLSVWNWNMQAYNMVLTTNT